MSQQLLQQIEYDLRPYSRSLIEGLDICFLCLPSVRRLGAAVTFFFTNGIRTQTFFF